MYFETMKPLKPWKQIRVGFVAAVLLGLGWSSSLRGDISLSKIFTDHMVLQQNSTVKVTGTAEPRQKLAVTFSQQVSKITADDQGHWAATIRTPAAGGPFELEVAAEEGEPKVALSNVMVGDVWVCAGHNMEWPVSKSLNPDTEIELSKNFPQLRLFTVDHNASVVALRDFAKVDPWRICSPETVADFSATAYFFGRELSKGLKRDEEAVETPIGLIDCSWEWSSCEAWSSRSSMDAVESLAPLLEHWDENDELPTDKNRPGNLYNGMIAPMAGFPIRGIIWYQGEANHGRGHQYATLFPTLISDWRKTFEDEKLPFYFVQLAPYRYQGESPQGLPEVWDAQLKTLKAVPHTSMVVTTDIGDTEEIHPKNKQEVGRRLSLAALSDCFEAAKVKVGAEAQAEAQAEAETEAMPPDPIVSSGPIYSSMSIEKERIRILFDHAQGLALRNKDEGLRCFLICGEDRKFYPAQAIINGEAVEVSSDKVSKPVAVRFVWDDSAKPNLVNGAGLPASPFRTDDFQLLSYGRDF